MEDEKAAAVAAAGAARVSSSSPAAAAVTPPALPNPPPPAPAKETAASTSRSNQRQMMSVELRHGETTIVSWKKLLKESSKGNRSAAAPSVSDNSLVRLPDGGGESKDGIPPPSRFSAVVQKIERLYMGKHSSDEEELDDIPDDDEYDTEDSFIDDAELDEYFEVDKSAIKHSGFFVNKGKLERIESSSSPNLAPKKRRRKDSTKVHSEKDHKHDSGDPVNIGNMRIKAAARTAPTVGKKLSDPAKLSTSSPELYHDRKKLKRKLDKSIVNFKQKSSDLITKSETPSMKISSKDVSSIALESKDFDKHKTGVSRDLAHKLKGTNESFDGMHQSSGDKGVTSQVESQPKKLSSVGKEIQVSTYIRRKERNEIGELPDLNSSGTTYPSQTAQPSSTRPKADSSLRPKSTTLERAMLDLEWIVKQSRPQNLDVQEVDTSAQASKKRLPQVVKQKLAKVARISASQGRVSADEITDRLMGILGHLVQRKTLMRNMKEMVEAGLSAKQQKADRFQHIKKEVQEMIRMHISLMKSKVAEQQDGSADDFQETVGNDESSSLKGKYSMNKALEDKICELYDLYVEGLDEVTGPLCRKLYVQLAEMWPSGYMDNRGVKDAIYKSKERKRALSKQHKKIHEEERMKRKRVDEPRERLQTESSALVLASPVPAQTLTRSVDRAVPPQSYSGQHHHEKAKSEDGGKMGDSSKRKLKRRSESDVEGSHGIHPKQGKEKPRPHKQHSDGLIVGQPPAGPPASHQPS